MARATGFGSRAVELGDVYNSQAEDIVFGLTAEVINGDIKLVFTMHNTSAEVRKVFIRATANASYYTGTTGEKLADTSGDAILRPGESKYYGSIGMLTQVRLCPNNIFQGSILVLLCPRRIMLNFLIPLCIVSG